MISEFNNRYVHYEYQKAQSTLIQQWFYTGYKNALHLLPHFNEVLDLQKAYKTKNLVFDFRNFVYLIPGDLIYFLRMEFIPRLKSINMQSVQLINSKERSVQLQFEHLFANCTNVMVQPGQIFEQPLNNQGTLLFN
ncbi:MAG TPA: hypothetical protein DCS93_11755 [Microscillaceae bacterium]|nr:hypothetical protein [Microscillaceae bacterium]